MSQTQTKQSIDDEVKSAEEDTQRKPRQREFRLFLLVSSAIFVRWTRDSQSLEISSGCEDPSSDVEQLPFQQFMASFLQFLVRCSDA